MCVIKAFLLLLLVAGYTTTSCSLNARFCFTITAGGQHAADKPQRASDCVNHPSNRLQGHSSVSVA